MQIKRKILKTEKGITLVALILSIIIIVILVAVTIKNITGDEPIIDISSETVNDYKINEYKEQIEQTIQSTVISKSAIGEITTIGEIEITLKAEDWVKATILNPTATADYGDITIQTEEGYVYQAYYNNIYGYTDIEYIGRNLEQSKNLSVKAEYEKKVAGIIATSEAKSGKVIKQDLIHKQQIARTIDNPEGKQTYKIENIGTGWYKVRATSNSGAIKFAWVRATNTKDTLIKPKIDIETEGKTVNGWYGADKEELWIKISTTSPSAKTIHYALSGAHNQADIIGELIEEGNTKYTRFQITKTGITKIVAWTQDETDNYSSEEAKESVKFDDKPPTLEDPIIEGTEGTKGWYTSAVKIKLDAKDLNGKAEGEVQDPRASIDKYTYSIEDENGSPLVTEKEIKKAVKQTGEETSEEIIYTIIQGEPSLQNDGQYKIKIQAVDQAGNKSEQKEKPILKDTKKPTIDGITIDEITAEGFKITVEAEDTTSKIAYYEYYLNGSTEGEPAYRGPEATWTPNGLADNTDYKVIVKAYDNAGLSEESMIEPTKTLVENTDPVVEIVNYKSKETNSITVTAKATDAQNDNLIYTIAVSTDGVNWVDKQSTGVLAAGTETDLTASGLSQYTDYYVKVRATESTTREEKLSDEENCNVYPIRTYCPGMVTCARDYQLFIMPW